MSNSGTMRGRGRPPKAGGPLALLDELLKGAPPELLPEIEANIGKPNDLMRDPAEVAETLARDRAHMLKAARPARARKRTEQERAASVARADRLTVLAGVVPIGLTSPLEILLLFWTGLVAFLAFRPKP